MPDVTIDDKELAELKKLAGSATKTSAALEALQGELTTAKAAAARVAALEAEVGTYKAAQLDQTFVSAGITDAKVRRVFQLEFDEQAAEATGEKDLGKWLGALQTMEADKRPALLAPFIKAAGAGGQPAGTGAAGAAGAGGLPNADKGAREVQGAPTSITVESIEKMDNESFAANFAKLKAAIPGMQGFELPPGFRPASA